LILNFFHHQNVQVTMEDQLICGALQTLNEEACEDVLEGTEDEKSKPAEVSLHDSEPGERNTKLSADYTCISVESDE
jgi:hypothetical protein